MMKVSVVALTLATLAFAGPAMAYENFIPLGTGYSTDVDSLPNFSSPQGKVIVQTDIYESELYRKAREAQENMSRTLMMRSNPHYTGTSNFIDY